MSQHDFEIANQGFPSFRSDLNNGLQALASNSAGATEPSTTYAYQFWYDETTDLLKMRNGDDDAWITLAFFDQTNDEWEVRSAVIQAVDSAGVTIKNDGGTTLIEAKDDGTVVFRTDDVTIDTSGNLLVGKTSASGSGTAGHEMRSDGLLISAKNGVSGAFGRLSTDGDIVQFAKDGSTVGSIGVNNSATYIAPSTGYGIKVAGNDVRPVTTAGANSDAALDLGTSFTRYKDLYLSGGVYLGGTGSSNYLDDYEEGTWTPTLAAGTPTINATSQYTKVGNLVTIFLDITYPVQTNANDADIFSLPFTSAASIAQGAVAIFHNYSTSSNVVGRMNLNSTRLRLFNGSGLSLSLTNMSGKDLRITAQYTVS